MIRWLRRRETGRIVNSRLMELETAKQILEEVFHARPSDVNDMIQRRLEEKSWQSENGQWPQEFCAGE